MSIAITDEHLTLARTVADFLAKREARAANRAMLESHDDALPP